MAGERCEACGNPAGASWRGHTASATDGIDGPLCPECWDCPADEVADKVRITRLRDRLAKAEAVIEAAKKMRSWYDKQMGPEGPEDVFDSALQTFDSPSPGDSVSPGSDGRDSSGETQGTVSPSDQRAKG